MKRNALTKTFLIALLCLSSSFLVKAQFVGLPSRSVFGSSPTAAGLGEYANQTMGTFTGLPNIQIPLFTVSDKKSGLSVDLSYNSSGVKISDIASNVGLGWVLNCGGVITRTVRSTPDDSEDQYLGYGWMNTKYQEDKRQGFTGPIDQLFLRVSNIDTEPDIFFFNFMGRTGKFFFAQNTDTASLVPFQNLRFSVVKNTSKHITEFNVVDEQGNNYKFGALEITQMNSNQNRFVSPHESYGTIDDEETSAPPEPYTEYTSSWYLTEITTSDGKKINFSYATENYTYGMTSYVSVRNFNEQGVAGCDLKAYKDGDPGLKYSAGYSKITIRGKRIASIEGDEFKVVFEPGLNREDLVGNYAIGNIIYYKKYSILNELPTLEVIKSFRLNYSYINSPTSGFKEENSIFGAYIYNNENNNFKRLKLDTVTEYDASGTPQSPYILEYNNDIPLPHRNSLKQDFWGYFNNNDCASLIPTLYVYPYNSIDHKYSVYPIAEYENDLHFVLPGADRTVNPQAIISGTLSKLTYPTKGYTQFNFEPKDFYWEGENRIGGGIRLASKVDFDGLDHSRDKTVNYSYKDSGNPSKSSGVIFQMPTFAYAENFPNYYEVGNIYSYVNNPFAKTDPRYYDYNLVRSSTPRYSLSSYDGVDIGYREVTKFENGNGKIVQRFSTPAPYGTVLISNDQDDSWYCDPAEQGFCDFIFKTAKIPVVTPQWDQPSYYLYDVGMDFTYFSFPYAPSMNYDWNRGQLLSVRTYDNNGTLLAKTTNDYRVFTPRSTYRSQTGLVTASQHNWRLITTSHYYIYQEYPIISDISKVLSRVSEKKYFNGDSTEVITDLDYNKLALLSKKQINQIGESKIKTYLYTYPIDIPADPVASQLQTLGRSAVHLQELVQSNGTELSQIRANYKDWGINVRGSKIIELESVTRKLNGSPLPAEVKYLNYDSEGNPIYAMINENVPVTYLWSYNSKYPIAEIKNADYSTVIGLLGGAGAVNTLSASMPTDAQVNAILGLLRNAPQLKKAEVMGFTYRTHYGMTSTTDAKGMTTYYEYDASQRLRTVKDQEGNILKLTDYHYKN